MTPPPEIGARILEHAGLRDIAAWVRAHHERLDGRGYPDGLDGDGIPLESRILAVADAYEAMIADRPYRRGLPAATARGELAHCAGTQFDPTVVEAFLGTLRAPRARTPRRRDPLVRAAASAIVPRAGRRARRRVRLADGDADEALVAERRRRHVGASGGVDRGGERVRRPRCRRCGGRRRARTTAARRARARVGVDARRELVRQAMCSPTWWRSPRAP